MSPLQAANQLNITKQAVYLALRKHAIPTHKIHGRWKITQEQLEHYKKNKYNRALSKFNGELIFDKEKGYLSVQEAAKLLNCSIQHIYYVCRINKLKNHRVRRAWVIHQDDLENYRKLMSVKCRSDFSERKKIINV